MAIESGYKTNFETLQQAFANGDVCLLETTRASSGEKVVLICAVQRTPNDEIEMVPFAEMCAGDPYELYNPPVPEDA